MAEARILQVTDAEYFLDPCERPSLSQSIAKTLLEKSPLHAWQEHPRLGGVRRAPTAAMKEGSLLDALLLSNGADVVVIDAKDFRTNAAKEERDAAIADGKLPVVRSAYDEAMVAVTKIRARLADQGITLNGTSQLAIEWTEETIHGPVLCRGKLDHVADATIYDLKKSRTAKPESCSRHVFDYGYHIQDAAYRSALEKLHPEFVGRTDFVFLFVEDEPPYAGTPGRLTGMFRELGRRQWEEACTTWAWCLSRNVWPAYTDGIVAIDPPQWAMARLTGSAAE
jgi:hypothetical protein